MKVKELINYLEKMLEEHGDVVCVISEEHEYWGSIQTELTESNIIYHENTQPNGPKSGKTLKGLIFNGN